ncbi:MAG: dihydropteroate synthase [Cytophagaceae bacterium]
MDLTKPVVMGIINITPDSFYVNSRRQDEKQILEQAEKMLSEGAAILDCGGYSTRPGADDISIQQEKSRVLPAIETIARHFPESIISVDTFRAEVAEAGINAGAAIINDVSGGSLDREMIPTIGKLQVPYILMHMRGTPQTMKALTNYDNLMKDLLTYFHIKIKELYLAGVKDIIIDPGIGFAKTADHNFEILRKLNYLNILNYPILVGLSRKSFIYKTLETDPEESLNGTSILNTISLMNGASILRVHDVKAAAEAIKLYNRIYH